MTTPWRSLATDPPPEGVKRVLATNGRYVGVAIHVAEGEWVWEVRSGRLRVNPEYWQPLPDARVAG